MPLGTTLAYRCYIYSMKHLFVLITLLFLSACATSVNVDYDLKTNFASIKTFQVQSKPVNVIDDPRIDSSFMQERIINAIGDTLTLKGMAFTKSEPDVIVKYYLLSKQEIESDDSGVTLGFGTGTRHSFLGMAYSFPERDISSVDNLVVTIDMFDDKDNLLWRGSLGRRLFDGSTPASNTKLVNEMVAEILERFPPK